MFVSFLPVLRKTHGQKAPIFAWFIVRSLMISFLKTYFNFN